MKKAYIILGFAAAVFLNACATKNQKASPPDFPVFEDRYFGETPPGLIPKLFDPAIVSPDGLFEGGSFSPDMREFYFTRKNGKYKERKFFVIRYENGEWDNESETDIRWPHFSTDGTMMYGGKWYRERTETGWSELKSQGEFMKNQAHGTSLSASGTYYFGYYTEDDPITGSIRYSRLINGEYEAPQDIGDAINAGTYISHPFIAPDESYLMWDAKREDGHGGSDIFISFRAKDGTWLPAQNMGDKINTALQESSAGVSRDGKYLFFSRGEWKTREDSSTYWVGKPYWVDAQVIETLRPDPNLQNIAATSYPIAYGSNGICLTNEDGTSTIRLTVGQHGYPAWSPDGKTLAFYGYYDGGKTWSIHTINSDGSNQKRLTHVKNKWDNMPVWSPDGSKIIFGRDYRDATGAWHYEIWKMNADGSQQTQIESLSGGGPSFLPDGRLLYHSEYKDKESEISIADLNGENIIHLTDNEAEEWDPKISPDGKQIAFMSKRNGNREIYVMNTDGSDQTRLTHNEGSDGGPTWSPDGAQIVFHSETKSDGEDNNSTYIMNKDGSSLRKLVHNSWQPSWFKIPNQ